MSDAPFVLLPAHILMGAWNLSRQEDMWAVTESDYHIVCQNNRLVIYGFLCYINIMERGTLHRRYPVPVVKDIFLSLDAFLHQTPTLYDFVVGREIVFRKMMQK